MKTGKMINGEVSKCGFVAVAVDCDQSTHPNTWPCGDLHLGGSYSCENLWVRDHKKCYVSCYDHCKGLWE